MCCFEIFGSASPRRRLLTPLFLSSLAFLSGCAAPVTGVVRLGDGLLKAATAQEAEAYCRNFGDPTRVIKEDKSRPDAEVLFRCD